jgi:hypothetical protein
MLAVFAGFWRKKGEARGEPFKLLMCILVSVI